MHSTFGFLKKVPLFADLADADLEKLCGMVRELTLEPQQWLFHEGEAGDRAFVIQSGSLEILKKSVGREVLLALRGEGEVVGEMSLLEDAPRVAGARARGETRLLAIDRGTLEGLVRQSTSAALILHHTVIARLRSTVSQLRQSEKMAQIGTLAAGVAHELNNPSAAVQRAAAQLGVALQALAQAQLALGRAAVDPATLARPARREGRPLTPLERSDVEAAVEELLERRGIAQPWELAANLVEDGWDAASVEAFAGSLPGPALAAALGWAGSSARVEGLLDEVREGAKRMSGIVEALKSYSQLDRAALQDVDVNRGLQDTLMILRGKLKAFDVRTELDAQLPRLQGFGGELNQVWTNLIDNAADALAETGSTLTVRSRVDGGRVRVEVQDDGPGIPPQVQERIFDAFFTTKPPGKGSGLGLNVAWRIVVERHGGELLVESAPGRTAFTVLLPLGPKSESLDLSEEDRALRALLERTKSIAVVGISSRPERPAHSVPAYLKDQGYRILPVTTGASEVLGERAVAQLADLEMPVDLVVVFRPSAELAGIVEEAIGVGAKAVWAQEGIHDDAAVARAKAAGLTIVTDRCIRATHRRVSGNASG